MEALKIHWSLDKHQALEADLKGFWANDEWDITKCPLFGQQKRVSSNRYINFGCNSPTINAELKYACWQKLIKQEWSINTLWIHKRKIKNIVEWLNSVTNKGISLLENMTKDGNCHCVLIYLNIMN
ncbi:hypothetical protein PI95_023610 [Hassallia byssoidea VB512170]|uniref:Uncharacterized protein n=1 Tax=Hassallia byssoidea VB512170 TaxID=1304833 RepID=A0A846HDJ3_9CYAN|nr:hypothetical protein [Hassalia byssoidea]NEU75462.1 hypothetical protein [Hassalia byssoidea VB512170]